MAAPKMDLNDLLRKVPLNKMGRWAKANAEKLAFWILVLGLLYTVFLVYQSYQKPVRVLPQAQGGEAETTQAEVPLKVPSMRGYHYGSYYGIVAERNPFVACEKIEVPMPAKPALIFVQFGSDQLARFKDAQGGMVEMTVGQSLGPWKLEKVEQKKATFRTRYDHVCEIALSAADEIKPAPPAPVGFLFQGKQGDAAWVAPEKNPQMEQLVPLKFNFGKIKPEQEGWTITEIREDRMTIHYAPAHPFPPKDVVWTYVDPPIPITYTGQSHVGEKNFAHFRIDVMDRRGRVEQKSRTAMENEMMKDTSFRLDSIAPDHVIVSRGERTYRLQLKELTGGADKAQP